MPAEFGRVRVRVTPDAALRWLKPGAPAFDPVLLSWVRRFVTADSVVWDIGANVGVFAIASAHHGAQVLAVEADTWLSSLLLATTHHPTNQAFTIEVLCAAVGAEAGTSRLAIAQRGRASNYLEEFGGRQDAGGIRETQLVPILTLDSLLPRHSPPTLVKIDVEGAESAVLRGAQNLLMRARPTFLIEVGEQTRDEVVQILSAADYDIRDAESGVPCDRCINHPMNLLGSPR